MDYSTRLPPRKRLLAGMKTQQGCEIEESSDSIAVLPFRFHSLELRARVQEVLDRSYSSAEEFVEASNSVALAAKRAAAEARADAIQKAEIAARVKAFARGILEAVTLPLDAAPYCVIPHRGKKKRIGVGELYSKSDQFDARGLADDEIARRLHSMMNTSPRRKVPKIFKSEAVGCRNSPTDLKGGSFCKVRLVKSKEQQSAQAVEGCNDGEKSTSNGCRPTGKKVKAKKKKVLLSQFCGRVLEGSNGGGSNLCHSFSKQGVFGNNAGGLASFDSHKLDGEHNVSAENQSLGKPKKMKLSEVYSGERIPVTSCSKQVEEEEETSDL